jgi:hypothetical protein
MWSEASEQVCLARQVLLKASQAGPVLVLYAGESSQGSIYRVLNQASDLCFRLEVLRQAALTSRTCFVICR